MVLGTVQLASQLFCNVEETVINYKGDNFYKACEEPVTSLSSCVFPGMFPHEQHVDFAGVTTDVQQKLELNDGS